MTLRRISEKQIKRLAGELTELAYNLWQSWHPSAQKLFMELSPFFWENSNHNAAEVMNWISGDELKGRLEHPDFFERVDAVCKKYRSYMGEKDTWVKKHTPALQRGLVAYFSAEFGLHESLRIYSGGLGILAGDHMKSASDLGVPLVGISLFYRQGYFRQHISSDGWQQEHYPLYDPTKLPMRLVTDKRGKPVVLSVEIGNTPVSFRTWEVAVGRVTVFLLDTDLPVNQQFQRDLTAHVYGGDQSNRIGQEILLGIGGVRLLRALGLKPSVFHMNEGHSAFLTLELLREQLHAKKTHDQAEAFVRRQSVFTTHTPVPAGHDRFDRGLMEANLASFGSSMGLSVDELMRYGRVNPENSLELFTMTILALRMSRDANGVSELHGAISREMWRELYPGTPVEKIPIGHVTNGIHVLGWASPTATEFWTNKLGPRWIEKLQDRKFWHEAASPKKTSDADLWLLRRTLRRQLVEFVRKRLRDQHLLHGGATIDMYDNVLSPDALTIGFARRFATYKRAPLFFRDFEWAVRTLANKEKPVQIIFAGKAHPRDDAGKHLIKEIVNHAKRHDLFGKVIFLENYDINVARFLISGCDIWLNTPRRPLEASGTSGMKIAIHGGLHCSTMDGWWREAHDGENGWKIGEDTSVDNEQMQDDSDAASLRAVMENDIIPLFYDRGKDGIPHRWLKRVRHAMATIIPFYNTDRMVAEYVQKYYIPDERKKRRS